MRIGRLDLKRLGGSGFALLLWLAAVAPPAAAQSEPDFRLLPPDSLLALEVPSVESALREFVRSRRLFPLRPGSESVKRAVIGERIEWIPFLPAAAALAYALELPYRDDVRRALAGWLERSSGPCGFGLLPEGRFGAEPVLAFTFGAGAAPERVPEGLHVTTEGRIWIVSPSQEAARRVKDHLARATNSRRGANDADHPRVRTRMRIKLKALLRRRPVASESALSVLRYFVAGVPDTVEVIWQGGEETIRVGIGPAASLLEPTTGRLEPTYLYCSVRFSGKLAIPEGLGALSGILRRDPLGIRTVLSRAWPVETPALSELARHLTGRFQILVQPCSGGLLPVVGIEVRNPRAALARLGRLLVASGVCEQHPRAEGVFEFPYRLPPEVRRNHMLLVFFRSQNQRREYRVALTDGWIWLGPRQETEAVVEAYDADREIEADPNRPAPDPASALRPAYGRFQVNTAPLWDDLVHEHGSITFEGEVTTRALRRLRESRGELADALGLFSYEIGRDGSTLELRRRVPSGKSLLTVLAAYGYRSYEELSHEEQQVRRAARNELRTLLRAQLTHRVRYGRFAPALSDLVRTRLWPPNSSAGDPAYTFQVDLKAVGPKPRLVLYAIPRGPGPAGRRPAYLIQEDGKLFTGRAESSDVMGTPQADLLDHGWRRVVE